MAGRHHRAKIPVYVIINFFVLICSRLSLFTSTSDGLELMIILTSTFAQALAGSGPRVNIIGVIIVWRFIMGVGVGGDRFLSAVNTSEFASRGSRGRLMTTLLTAQGWGNFGTQRHFYIETSNTKVTLVASLVVLITVHAYRDTILTTDNLNDLEHIDWCWRILLGLGCVPGTIAVYLRLTIPETLRFTMDIDRDIQKARTDVENVLGLNSGSAAISWVDSDAVVQRADAQRRSRTNDFINFFARPGNLLLLFGAAYSWFAIDASPISYIGWCDVITDLRLTGRFLRPRSQFVFDFDFGSPYLGRDWLTLHPVGYHHYLGHMQVVVRCCHRQLGCLRGSVSASLLCIFLPHRCLAPEANSVSWFCHVDSGISYPI